MTRTGSAFPLLTALLMALAAAVPGRSQPNTFFGTDLWAGFMRNYQGNTPQFVRLVITSGTSTSGEVTVPQQGLVFPFAVAAFSNTVVDLPLAQVMNFGSETIGDRGVHVTALDPVSVVAVNYEGYTADAANILPVHVLGSVYRVQAYTGLAGFPDLNSEFLLVGTADPTTVQITPSAPTSGGHPAGQPFTVTLGSGDTYQVLALSGTDDLSGSLVEVTDGPLGACTPLAVFSGAVCANVPAGCSACDHLFTQNLPIDRWGLRYLAAPVLGTNAYTLRIMASMDATSVSINGAPPLMLNAGDLTEMNGVTGPACVEADAPVHVVQLLEGLLCNGSGDPAIVALVPDDQGITNAVFSNADVGNTMDATLTVVADQSDIGQVMLDGLPLDANLFAPFTGCPDKVYARTTVGQGTHVLGSNHPVQGYLFTTGQGISLAYALGAHTPDVATVLDTLVCHAGGPITLDAPMDYSYPIWTLPLPTGDTLGSGPSLTLVVDSTTTILVTDTGGTPPNGCLGSGLSFVIEVTPAISVELTANDTMPCASTIVQFAATVAPNGAPHATVWTNTTGTLGPDSAFLAASASNWTTVTVTSPLGCSIASDSIYLTVQPSPLHSIDATAGDSLLCLGEVTTLYPGLVQAIASDDLNAGLSPIWSQWNGVVIDDVCGSGSGDAMMFYGPAPRLAVAGPFDLTQGGMVRWNVVAADGNGGCDAPEAIDQLALEYSTNGGSNWTNILLLAPSLYQQWTLVETPIPAGAMQPAVLLRWRETNALITGEDIWVIDDMAVVTGGVQGVDFEWTPSTGLNDPLAPFPVASPLNSTWYSVVVTDPGSGCTLSDSALVNVGMPFTVQGPPDTTFCGNTPLQLTADPGTASGPSYFWTTNLGAIQGPDQQTTTLLPVPGTATVVLTVTSTGCTASDTVLVTAVQAPPPPIIGQTGDTLLATVGYASYSWTLNGVVIPGADQDTLVMNVSGLYTVTVANTAGCTATSTGYWGSPLGINTSEVDAFQAWSDPIAGTVVVQIDGAIDELSLHDAAGRTIEVRYGPLVHGQQVILPVPGPGVYLLLVRAQQGGSIRRFVSTGGTGSNR